MNIADEFEFLCKSAMFSPGLQKLTAQNRAGYLKPIMNTKMPPGLGGTDSLAGGIRPTNNAPKVNMSMAPKPLNI